MKVMLTREELLRDPDYWFENIQNKLFRQLSSYLEEENISKTEFAEKLGVTKGYISQVMQGNFNYTLKKLIDLSLAIDKVPSINFKKIDEVINQDKLSFQIKNSPLLFPTNSKIAEIENNMTLTLKFSCPSSQEIDLKVA